MRLSRLSLFLMMTFGATGCFGTTTLFQVTGPTCCSYSVGSSFNVVLAQGWTTSVAEYDVSVSATLLGLGGGSSISAYLTNQIGPGTTIANQIATTTITPPTGSPQDVVLFSGLNLAAGSYYLVLAGPAGTTQSWYGTTSPTLTQSSGITGDFHGFAFTGQGSPDLVYAPNSTFIDYTSHLNGSASPGEGWFMTVSGTEAPEPSTFAMMALAGVIGFAYKARKSHAKA